MDAALKRPGGPDRYLAVVAGAIAVPILAVSVISSGGAVGPALEMLGILLTFGAVGWGPVAVLAIVPGWLIFRRMRRAIGGTRVLDLTGPALAALVVAGVASPGAAVPTLLLPDGPEGGPAARSAVVFADGAPGGVLSGLALSWRED